MNLQVNSPYVACPYRCAYCVAGFEGEKSLFNDSRDTALYFTDWRAYMSRLAEVVWSGGFDTAVITGSTEPTLFDRWVRDVLSVLAVAKGIKTELTTRNTGFMGQKWMDAVSYSFDRVPERVYVSQAKHTRAVFILHDGLDLEGVVRYHREAGGQTTVKNMARNSYGNKCINDWVERHRVTLTELEIERLENEGIRYDHDCNNSAGRYMIFRADGNLYESWQAIEPVGGRRAKNA